jgi:hypothetical protein
MKNSGFSGKSKVSAFNKVLCQTENEVLLIRYFSYTQTVIGHFKRRQYIRHYKMTKDKLRKIKIDSDTYLWKREHLHLTEYVLSKCVEKVVIYLEGHKKSPLQLLFREEDNLSIKMDIEKEKWCVGYPNDGVVWLYKYKPPLPNNAPYPMNQQQTIEVNLNRPAVIAELIGYFLHTDWNPKESTRPHIVEDALKLLEIIVFPKGITC